MNPRELAEIRRRLNPDKCYPTVIRGLYTTDAGEVISEFAVQPERLSEDEREKYMALFKKVLSGTPGQNLLPVEFTSDEVMNGETHPLLMDALSTALTDEASLNPLYERILAFLQAEHSKTIESVTDRQNAANRLVLMLHDGYDIPGRDGNGDIDRENSTNVMHYLLCCVCPVKQGKPALSYSSASGEFHTPPADWSAAAPELGFMFPAYEEGGANIYRAMYYTRDSADLHADFIQNVFGTALQMTAEEQKETFQNILTETLDEDCSLETVQAVHEAISGMIEEHKTDKTAEPLTLTGKDMRKVLEDCGVAAEKAEVFEEKVSESFGEFAEVPAVNVVSPRQFKVEAPGVSIRVSPECTNLLETRMIDGRRYILVPADGDVEVNGMKVRG